METILTGIRVNSDLTLGNFLGALLPMVRLANRYSNKYNINIFVPDLHSIISDIDGDLRQNALNSIKYYIAAGLKINNNIHFYRQSRVPAHSELAWILNCIATTGELNRMTQYKDKSNGHKSVGVGIFDYPVLMAADILLYDAKYVPVGDDQFQHIELTRNLAERFNKKYGENIFTLPEDGCAQAKFMGLHDCRGIRIRDLQNPEKKMSKSSENTKSKIMMLEDPADAKKKIMSATTDSRGFINFDFYSQPGISNLIQIYAFINDKETGEVLNEWHGKANYGDFKKQVAESVENLLNVFQTKLQYINNIDIEQLFETGEAYANKVANQKLKEVQTKIGLR